MVQVNTAVVQTGITAAVETQAKTQAQRAGRRGGQSRSSAKIEAARRNGGLGGRPPNATSKKMHPVMRLLTSSEDDSWETPQEFFAELDREFHFTLDAAASPHNAKCARFFDAEQNALKQDWSGRVWLNPPYGPKMTPAFIKKACEERNNCEVVVVLVPARTSTRWWRTYVWNHEAPLPGVTVRFPPRLRNEHPNKPGKSERRWPFPCAVIIYRQTRLAASVA
jgi:hypothetical protein